MSETEVAPPAEFGNPVDKVHTDREFLKQAAAEGRLLSAFVRLSGPGWLQSAITLGGGSLAGALFLGVLGGTSMIWLQLMAITMGVIMLSAISYVTLSTGRRPFEAINTEINPALGWGWLIATMMANMIWCMPQFSLCYDALDKNLMPLAGQSLGEDMGAKRTVSLILLFAAGFVVLLNTRRGAAAKLFDITLKALVGMVVICFFGVAILLGVKGELDFGAIFSGLIPNLNQWTQPTGDLAAMVASLSEQGQSFWTNRLVTEQRAVMIAAAATAVGINMTFLLPYSMLARGWDKPFRGLARFDLATGMAIPYVLVTSCVVIAAASTFHGKIDDQLASNDLSVMEQSPMFDAVKGSLIARVDQQLGDAAAETSEADKLAMVAQLDVTEKKLASTLVKRNAFQLADTLAPLLGVSLSKLVFGLGVFGMGFSTIIILMLINGYAFREMFNQPDGTFPFVLGVVSAGLFGFSWMYFWAGGAKFWLAIFTSSFGMMLLPIAYITFFLMMNSRRILGDEKPTGGRMLLWNVLMIFAVLGALAAAATAIYDKVTDKANPVAGQAILGLLVVYLILIAIGFFVRKSKPTSPGME
ncbi:divalent metal cation transporter [Rosistilla oblonga]|uniref:Natural resistance-associated macrophage protein n=1 Tax=Rosistilla oblonga TaxID=2527990 RepID=A0A518IRG8_9BACT|nr:divalent metal cation transporter [Rosistilla oblonga]QDV55695.1 Natural resistance-associated macrophage protein [Rosistilla oblonga]